MRDLVLEFKGEPKAIQSMKIAKRGDFIAKYQPKKNVDWKNYIKLSAESQLHEGFEITTKAVSVVVLFVYAPPKSWSKKKLAELANGKTFYKQSRPDLHDNLCKGLFDALTGTVWKDDSQVVELNSSKVYGKEAKVLISINEVAE